MEQLVLFGYLVPAALEMLLFIVAPRVLASLAVVPLSVARALPLPVNSGADNAYRVPPGPVLERLALPRSESLSLDGAPGAIAWHAGHAWARVPRWSWRSKSYALVRVDFHEIDSVLACTSRYLPFPFLGLLCGALFGGAFLLTALGEPALFVIALLVAFALIITVLVRKRARDAAERLLDAIAARISRTAVRDADRRPESCERRLTKSTGDGP